MEESDSIASETFFQKHFGVIITAIVSSCAVVVSIAQIWVATINKEKELAITELTAKESRVLDERKSTRQWQLDLAEFMAKYREEIFTPGDKRFEFQQIMLATFPKEVTLHVFGSLSEISDSNDDYWSKAESRALNLYEPRAKIYYEEGFPNFLDQIADTIGEGEIEYNYDDQVIPEGLSTGDVRYFHESDRELALQVKSEFTDFACYAGGLEIALKIIPLTNSKMRAPKGTVEVWLSSKSIIKKVSADDC
ncbi:hypothetical protein L1D29_03250 [Shewanella insulae]|uniref:hypothetical protein n=1 Tax=Shewanella insulae TaxID=2681496 RepID=UPI001EFE4AAE|nr:hypothetical protein [Shewanella insulae]MCG9711835.1 hypothetical protein [Shewanella insulae]